MNLIHDPWVPVRQKSGSLMRVSPWQVTEHYKKDPIIEVATPRPDFNGALTEFLIGLLQTTAIASQNPRQWRSRLDSPPVPEELHRAFRPIAHAFEVIGEGPRFMQDLTLEKEIEKLPPSKRKERVEGIGSMLIEAPGGNTLLNNTDLFIKRGLVEKLCPACAAVALFTLQTYAPAGGQGNRTGIRGGGPLTTLIRGETLWQTCWLNTLMREDFLSRSGNTRKAKDSDRFPWMSPTRTSDDGAETTPQDVHPDQLFWAMPRRIRLLVAAKEPDSTCDLCGEKGSLSFRNYVAKNLGVNYAGPWMHPLSPYFIANDGTPSAVHPQPGGIGYRHWLGLVQSSQGNKGRRQPARAIERFVREVGRDLRLWAFGYDMDNMKARCWYDSIMPLVLADPAVREAYEAQVAALVSSAQQASRMTRGQIKKAWFRDGAEVTGDLSFVEWRLWHDTEGRFFESLHRLRDALTRGDDAIPILKDWHRCLVQTARAIFDEFSQAGAFEAVDPRRVALAWHGLQRGLYGRKLREQLGLPAEPRAA